MSKYKIKLQPGDGMLSSLRVQLSGQQLTDIARRADDDFGGNLYCVADGHLTFSGNLYTYDQIMELSDNSDLAIPDTGSHLEVTFGNKSIWHECVVLPNKKIAIDRYAGWHVMAWQDDFEFRPLKSYRDKAIEAAIDMLPDSCIFVDLYNCESGELLLGMKEKLESFFGKYYDAGLLRLPEDKQ